MTRRRMVVLLLLGWLLTAPATVAQSSSSAGTTGNGIVTGGVGVNIRSCPEVDCAVVASAALGDSLRITGPAEDGWLPVSHDGKSGFVWGLYIATPDGGYPELRQGAPGCQRVAFVFNLGVGYDMQMEPLEYLAEQKIPASVFPMGWWARENAADLIRIQQLGFLIGSHGDQRTELTTLGDAAVVADITAASDEIEAVLGEKPDPYLTPYAADYDERVLTLIAKAGYLPVGFEVPADDWDFNIGPDAVFMNVVPNVVDGSIVEFHLDAPSSAESTGVALPWIVERLKDKGLTFVTVADMAQPCPAAAAAPASSSPIVTP